MRIIFWTSHYLPFIGGLGVFSHRLIKQLVKNGNEIIVLTYDPTIEMGEIIEDTYENIKIYRFTQKKSIHLMMSSIKLVWKIKKIVNDFKPDLIHVHGLGGDFIFYQMLVLSQNTMPIVLTVHGIFDEIDPEMGPFKNFLERVNHIILVSLNLLAEFKGKFGCSEKLSVIYNGIPCQKYKQFKKINLQETTFTKLLIVSRLSPEKGIDIAMKALKTLVNQGRNIYLEILGEDNPYHPQKNLLENLMKELKLQDYVVFGGGVEPNEVPKKMLESTLLLIPSSYEAFGLVAIEAGMLGIPVIASKVGGLQEIIIHNKTGLLVEPNNPEALSKAILTLVSSLELRNKFGEAARHHISNNFSLENTTQKYQGVYKTLIRKVEYDS